MARPTFLRRLNPLSKLAAALLYIVAATLVFDPVFQLSVIAASLGSLLILECVRPADLAKAIWPFALIGLGYLWVNLAFFNRASLYTWATAAVPLAAHPALFAGTTLFLRAVAFGAISLFFVRTTDPADLTRSLMLRAGLPPAVAFSLFSALQFLPGLREDLRLLRLARGLRAPTARRRWRDRLSSYPSLALPLLAGTIRKASRAAIAMEARGLSRPMARTSLKGSPLGGADAVFLVVSIGLLPALLTCLPVRPWP